MQACIRVPVTRHISIHAVKPILKALNTTYMQCLLLYLTLLLHRPSNRVNITPQPLMTQPSPIEHTRHSILAALIQLHYNLFTSRLLLLLYTLIWLIPETIQDLFFSDLLLPFTLLNLECSLTCLSTFEYVAEGY